MASIPTVLVAEDQALVRTLIVETLEAAGFHVLEAADGQEAILLIDDPDGISVVVTDVNMPKASGFTVADKARSHTPAIPIVFLSGGPNERQARDVASPAVYISKPVSLELLVSTIRKMINAEEF